MVEHYSKAGDPKAILGAIPTRNFREEKKEDFLPAFAGKGEEEKL